MKQIKCKKSKLTTLQQQYAALEELFSGEFIVCDACKHPRRGGKCWNCDVDLEFGREEYAGGGLLDVGGLQLIEVYFIFFFILGGGGGLDEIHGWKK